MKSNPSTAAQLDVEAFASIVSHDFRAPIRHINQFVAILVDSLEQVDEDQQRCIGHIKKSVSQCNEMMNGLARLAKIGQLSQPNVVVDCAAEFLHCVSQLESIYEHSADITMQVAHDDTPFIQLAHLTDLLFAITDNCFKFRDTSRKLAINMTINTDDENLLITICDNGSGMPENFIDQSTQVFSQYTSSTCGVGIGLTQASHIANHYGGVLNIANNKLGCGVQIEIRLPLAHRAKVA